MYVCKKYTFGILIFCKCLYYCLLWLFFRYAKTYALLFLMICKVCFCKYKIEFLPVELQGFKKKKITMGNDIETSEPLWFALFFHCLK